MNFLGLSHQSKAEWLRQQVFAFVNDEEIYIEILKDGLKNERT